MDCVKSISEIEPVYAKKWTGKSLTKAGLSQNFERERERERGFIDSDVTCTTYIKHLA